MRIIKPAEISGKIVSLIDEADKEIVVAFPYDDFGSFHNLFASFKIAIKRGVKVTFFVSQDVEYPEGLSELNVPVYYVEKLHAKIYLNEKHAVLTSANLRASGNDFGIETESFKELEEVKTTYLPFIQNVSCQAYNLIGSISKELFKNLEGGTVEDHERFTNPSPKKMKIFEAHFKKTFRRSNLNYNKNNDSISCNYFPFQWTLFEYSGMIKISFLSASTYDYKKFRKESIDEFNELFRNHKADWSYPYDGICIYGDEVANGINPGDINAQMAYVSYLIKEVTKFFQSKEDVLLKTRLYKLGGCEVYG